MSLDCELIVISDSEHLRQIYTGFSLLHRQGFLKLKQTIPKEFLLNKNDPKRWVDCKFFNLRAIINDEITIIYDMHDRHTIDEEVLREADFYFKRSYDENFVSQLKEKNKIFPLGLNYQVSSNRHDRFQIERAVFYSGKEKVKAVVKGFHFAGFDELETLERLESLPNFDLPPKVLFTAQVWDPNFIENKTQKEAVEKLNETRAESVRQLRKEFGRDFFGGLTHKEYAVKHYRDCLLPDVNLTSKRKHLEMLKDFPICVTTVGLNGSNGWKLGEYVAFSKAIVTEPLQYLVTGDFANGKNYLEFTTPEILVESVKRLFVDKDLRLAMMMNNYRYYQSYVRPDSLVLNSLAIVFRHASQL